MPHEFPLPSREDGGSPIIYSHGQRRIGGDETEWGAPQPSPDTATALSPFAILALIRRHVLLGIGLVFLGSVAGLVSIVLTTPVYSARVLLEIQGVSAEFLKNTFDPLAGTYDSSQTGIQTQITLLRSGPFLRRVFERMQFESVPPVAVQSNLFSKLRRHVKSDSQDPLTVMKEGLAIAVSSFDARPVNGTRLVELSCYATHPEIAANFINTVASEFIEDSTRMRTVSSRKTSEWLQGQIEETKVNVKTAEDHLQEFVRQSGNMFAAQENTVDDVKLKQLQGELASIQADRINKQARYEIVTKNSPEALPDLLPDGGLQGYTKQLADLKREKASLLTTLTPNHARVQRIQAQIDELQGTLQKETAGYASRLRSEYETALRREKLLRGAYTAQAGQVTSQSDRAAQYTTLRREVDMLRQIYNSLVMQANQASVSNSVPIAPIRLVDPSGVAQIPDRPRPLVNIIFGMIGGIFLTGIAGFVREKADRRVRSPQVVRDLLRIPQLGVIPSARVGSNVGNAASGLRRLIPSSARATRDIGVSATSSNVPTSLALTTWRTGGSSLLMESFRGTLASILGDSIRRPKTILVTSAGAGEGKTTVTANLGFALAETGRKVLLIDCDFRQPRLHDELGVDNKWGVTTLLRESTPVSQYDLQALALETETAGLYVLPGGPRWEGMPRAMHSLRFNDLLVRLRTSFDAILIDASPVLQFADARILGKMSDGVVFVLRSGVTHTSEAVDAYRRLADDRVVLLGTILNDWVPPADEARRRYYGYYSSIGDS